MTSIHATCVALNGRGVLLLGPPGSGKSDLAWRLIDRGFALVSDDQVTIESMANGLTASPPLAIAGLIEARGVGILHFDYQSNVQLALAVALQARDDIERLPLAEKWYYENVSLPLIRLHAFDASAPLKIQLALQHVCNDIHTIEK